MSHGRKLTDDRGGTPGAIPDAGERVSRLYDPMNIPVSSGDPRQVITAGAAEMNDWIRKWCERSPSQVLVRAAGCVGAEAVPYPTLEVAAFIKAMMIRSKHCAAFSLKDVWWVATIAPTFAKRTT